MHDVEIIETHHPQKLDAPSQTALKTAEMINAALSHTTSRGLSAGSNADIPIHSLRLPGFLANQQVIFGQTGETLTITHNSIDRVSFMPGILLACDRAPKLKHLVYGLEHVLQLG